jgi:hypothetical protein
VGRYNRDTDADKEIESEKAGSLPAFLLSAQRKKYLVRARNLSRRSAIIGCRAVDNEHAYFRVGADFMRGGAS